MTIDNFLTIEKILEFKKGTCYRFVATVDAKDGPNPIFGDHTEKNVVGAVMIKDWFISNQRDYENAKPMMKGLCDLVGARLYMIASRLDASKLVITAQKELLEDLQEEDPNFVIAMHCVAPHLAEASIFSCTHDKSGINTCITVETNDVAVAADIEGYYLGKFQWVKVVEGINCHQVIIPVAADPTVEVPKIYMYVPSTKGIRITCSESGFITVYHRERKV